MTGSQLQAGVNNSRFCTVSVAGLRVGVTLRAPIYDARQDRNILLLSAGTTITQSLLARLKTRGVSSVRVHGSELNRLTSHRGGLSGQKGLSVHRAEAAPERTSGNRWAKSPNSYVHKVCRHGTATYCSGRVEKFVDSFQKSVAFVESLFDGLSSGCIGDAAQMTAVSGDSLVKIAEDMDLFVAMGLKPAIDKYPCKHSLQTAMLAMTVGTTLGLKADELIELALGCLIHDAGMLHISKNLIQSKNALDRVEFLEITKHSAVTFDLMRNVKDMPNGSRLVAYQMHERLDGSGYPRQRTASQIHPLAKIAAVADVFIALISPRPHRPGMLPYHAMEQIIHGARKGLFDAAVVRGLLHTVSLFPIGSYVELNDGRVGKVIRANGESYTQPVLELWPPGQTLVRPEILNLAATPEFQIMRPVAQALPSPATNPDGPLCEDRADPEPDVALEKEIAFAADHWD